jgi:hypothetical protein
MYDLSLTSSLHVHSLAKISVKGQRNYVNWIIGRLQPYALDILD